MDRVKLYPQERLDLDDVRALQELVYDYDQEALGALLGPVRGVLSVPRVTVTENSGAPYMTLTPFSFITAKAVNSSAVGYFSESAQYKGIVANYLGSEESSAQISLDNARANYSESAGSWYLWARPVQVDTDTGTRRKWDVASGAEVTFSDETRSSQRVAFALQATEPSYALTEARWAPIAQLTAWSNNDSTGSVPTWRWLSAWDDDTLTTWFNTLQGAALTASQVSTRRLTAQSGTEPVSVFFQRTTSMGLLTQLAYMRYITARMRGTDWDSSSFPLTLATAQTRITALENAQTSPIQCIASCSVGITVLQELNTGSAPELYYPPVLVEGAYGVASVTPVYLSAPPAYQNLVNIRLDPAILAQGWKITSVEVQQRFGGELTTGHWNLNRCTFLVADQAYATDSSVSTQMLLADSSPTYRGVQVYFLPQVADTNHGHSERAIHFPDGVSTDTTPILQSLGGALDLVFSVSVFGVPV
jgi:hypothetical protein